MDTQRWLPYAYMMPISATYACTDRGCADAHTDRNFYVLYVLTSTHLAEINIRRIAARITNKAWLAGAGSGNTDRLHSTLSSAVHRETDTGAVVLSILVVKMGFIWRTPTLTYFTNATSPMLVCCFNQSGCINPENIEKFYPLHYMVEPAEALHGSMKPGS